MSPRKNIIRCGEIVVAKERSVKKPPWFNSYCHPLLEASLRDYLATWGKRTCPRFETESVGFELGTSGFRDPRSYPLGHRAPQVPVMM